MLAFCNKVAKQLYTFRAVLWVLGFMSVVAFAGILFLADGSISGSYALAALTSLLWALWLLAFAYGFVEQAPVIDSSTRFRTRLGACLKLGLLWIFVFVLAGLMAVAAILTLRTIGILFEP
jgi:hypothetical protein